MKKKILVVEEDHHLAELLKLHLQQAGYDVHWVCKGNEALQKVSEIMPDCMIVDWALPDIEGIDVCRVARYNHRFPIIIISARTAEIDAVLALELGATDYIRKPIGIRELLTRTRIHIERHEREKFQQTRVSEVRMDPFTVDLVTLKVFKEERELSLTQGEFKLFMHLFEHSGHIQSREEIIDALEFTKGDRRAVDVLVSRLRNKIEDNPKKPRWIKTKMGAGYYLNVQAGKVCT